MKNAIILHGKPSKEEYYSPQIASPSNSHWIPWLQKQLIVHDIKADAPEVPFAYDPQWELWVREIEKYEITPETILVGHSCGGGFWVRYLSEHKDLRAGKVVLVAPSLGYSGWGDAFFEGFTIDDTLIERTDGITIFGSSNDDTPGIQRAFTELREALPRNVYREFQLGHFTSNSMRSAEFPELLAECLLRPS